MGALTEARHSGGFSIFAYVIMTDHAHLITDGPLKSSATLRFVNGISSHRVISYLKEKSYATSLAKLRNAGKARGHEYSLWDGHSNVLPVFSESFLMQRVNYIHQNPMRAGLAVRAEDYRFSGARCWSRRILEDEPLLMHLDKIVWRRPPMTCQRGAASPERKRGRRERGRKGAAFPHSGAAEPQGTEPT